MELGLGLNLNQPGAILSSSVLGGGVSGTPSIYTFTESQTWTPPRAGTARVTCYGKCGDGGSGQGGMGGSGGGGGGGEVAQSTVIFTGVDIFIVIDTVQSTLSDEGDIQITAFAGGYGSSSNDGGAGGAGGAGGNGDVLHPGGAGGDGGGPVSGAGGTRGTPTADGVDFGGAPGVGDDQPGGIAEDSGGAGGGNGTDITNPPGGTGAAGYVTVEYL